MVPRGKRHLVEEAVELDGGPANDYAASEEMAAGEGEEH